LLYSSIQSHLSFITCCAIQFGCSALHYAAGNGSMTDVKYLVEECQAVISMQDKAGKTPISYAKDGWYKCIVHYLKAQAKIQLMKMMKMVMESNMLPFYTGVRSIIVKYLQ